MILLLDLGNSRLKWAFADRALGESGDLDWQQESWHTHLRERWQQQPAPQRILGAAVTSAERRSGIDAVLAQLAWPTAEWLHSPKRFGAVTSAYDPPADLGVDRFLSMLAAFDAGQAPCVIASGGTALTLDALDADGRHLGGQIMPGIQAMMSGLRAAAPGLPDARAARCVNLASSTADAMVSGVSHAAAGAIEHFLALASKQMTQKPQLLLCGGHARQLAELLQVDARQFPQAVLQGLLVWSHIDPKL